LDLIINKENLPPDKAKHYAEIAYNKSLQMEHLISELFNYTKLNFGDGNISKERIDLAYLIRQMFEEFMPIFLNNGLHGRLKIKDEPIFIEADGNMIARVFDNIITNAIRYGSDGKYVDIELLKDGDEVIARVINYDSLIAPEDLPHIFDTFYRADKSRSSKESLGSGLGLAIAKNIIDLHGGSISVQSSLEKTCFEIRLHLAVFRKN
jgi:signal transduction histidine kinase